MVSGTGCIGASGAKSSRMISRSSCSVISCSLDRFPVVVVEVFAEDGAAALELVDDSFGWLVLLEFH